MNCPFCSKADTGVRNSRATEGGNAVRRRRICESCGRRFTTFERVQLRLINVIKNDKSTETFDYDKLMHSIQIACRKRPVSEEQVGDLASTVQRDLEKSGEHAATSAQIGNAVMELLRKLDEVAYVRFASVYHNFADSEDFRKFIKSVK